MSKAKRFYFQILLWIIVWFILWISTGTLRGFIEENSIPFLCQIFLISIIIFYLAETFLFKKEYFLFAIICITTICICTFLSSYFFSPTPPIPPNHAPGMRMPLESPHRKPPSKFLINLLFLSFSSMLATSIEIFLFAQRKEEETIRRKSENLQTELKLLKSQINPHFLFNCLNNIYALSVINSDKTQQSISYLSNMLRYVLYECERPFVPLEKEITYVKNYIRLFSMKKSSPYPISLVFDIENPNVLIAPMIFIPFIENAIKHSNIEKLNGSYIKLEIKSSTEEVVFKIQNSIPTEEVSKDEVGGIGLENVKKRLAIVYPEKHLLHIQKNNGIFNVELNLRIDAEY
ncbi:sensor histidine kinase [Aquimarina pacifica]|uniref:sensor histidine kinase n=1 Tax=Aquimarina pacifica TaxID=1296415 RepID=UPI0004708AA5|nr:histidine kinase [Aquimarina pacifica]